ncbi:MAG: hypothetical protein KAJ91_02550, partial [Candidatus Aenigmarchaeota archaeon]|nr:hypothetical protein [Candidatus Aenigmarchaeota archaeon]
MKYYTNNFAAVLYLLLFLVLIYLSVFNFRSLKNYFSAINRKYWLCLLAVLVLGFLFRVCLCPEAEIVGADRWNYRMAAESMMGDYGVLSNISSSVSRNVGHPYGYSFLLAIAYIFFGISIKASYALNLLFGSLSIIAVFL